MAKDYKYRADTKKKPVAKTKSTFEGFIKSMGITAAIMAAVVLVLYAINLRQKKTAPAPAVVVNQQPVVAPQAAPAPPIQNDPNKPQFDFYAVLPEKDILIPDYEINTRAREEAIGKGDGKQYTMQAGSFKTAAEAQQLGAKLAAMGIETTIQKAKIGEVNWYRVKLGPYSQMSSVSTLRTRLRQNGIDAIVIEVGN
jgi:cell division protein FtsN